MLIKSKVFIATLMAALMYLPNGAKAASVPMADRLAELAALGVEVTYNFVANDAEASNPTSAHPVIYVSIVRDRQGRWVAEQLSFAPIKRASPQHEVLRFTYDNSLTVSPAFEKDVPLTSAYTPPIDEAIFSCSGLGEIQEMRARAGLYTICSTKFTRTSVLATGGMLLLAGPLGAGSYRLYSRGNLADAVLETGITPLIKKLLPALQAARAAASTKAPDAFSALRDVVEERATFAIGAKSPSAAYRDSVINSILMDANVQLAALRPQLASEFKLNLSSFAEVYPIEKGGLSPLAEAALANLTTNPPQQRVMSDARRRAEALLDAKPLRLSCTNPASEDGQGFLFWTTNWMLRYKVRCEPFSTWPKMPATGPGPQQSSVWSAPLASSYFYPLMVMKDFTFSDAALSIEVTEKGELLFENKTNAFVGIKSVSFYVGEVIVTQSFENNPLSLPPIASAKLQDTVGRAGDSPLLNALARQLMPPPSVTGAASRTIELTPFSTIMGFAILYEVNGQQRTLLRRQSFQVISGDDARR